MKANIQGNHENEVYSDTNVLKLLTIPNMLTLLNAICGITSVFYSIIGNYPLAITFMFLSPIFDFLDGMAARRFGKTGEFGKELDSLADIISFGVAPSVYAFTMNSSPFAFFAYTIFLSCAILRLAKFNIQKEKGAYYGMPSTINAFIVITLYLTNFPIAYYPLIFLASGSLMVSRFRIRKVVS
jgi:CDP-diacylglycerol--serine O-phosphatidyltransferase